MLNPSTRCKETSTTEGQSSTHRTANKHTQVRLADMTSSEAADSLTGVSHPYALSVAHS